MMESLEEDEARKNLPVKACPPSYSGFPVRVLTRPDQRECGEWITAYQAEQKRHLRTVMVSSKLEGTRSKVIAPPTNTREASSSQKCILNTRFLLENCYVNTPNDLSVANISGKELIDYKPEDFLEFVNVVSINGSDNHLPLEAFTTFPVLESLELSLNAIVDVLLERNDFQKLHSLNLSHNNLSGVALLSLGLLPALKELYLTGNDIVGLPVEMSMSYAAKGTRSQELRFSSLERLWLDDNKLSDLATFATLAGFRKLKYLNVDNNDMYTIPRLKLLSTRSLTRTSQTITTTATGVNSSSSEDHVMTTLSPAPPSAETALSHHGRISDGGVVTARYSSATPPPEGSPLATSAPLSPTTHKVGGKMTASTSAPLSPTTHKVGGKMTASMSAPLSPTTHKVEGEMTASPLSPTTRKVGGATSAPLSPTTHKVGGEMTASMSAPLSPTTHKLGGEKITALSSSIQASTLSTGPGTEGTCSTTLPNSVPIPGSNTNRDSHMGRSPQWSPTPVVKGGNKGGDFSPFPVLETLSMINNLILSPEGVLACESWPALKELIIYDNPLTRTSKGMPQLLQDRLVNKRGVNIVRMKPKPPECTTHIRKTAKDFKKVATGLPPPIPKHPLPAIEAPPTLSALEHSPSSHTQSPPSHLSFSPGTSESTSSLDSSEGIFMTQVTGADEPVPSPDGEQTSNEQPPVEDQELPQQSFTVKEAFQARLTELKLKYRHVPDRYKGYEALLDVGDDPTDNIPKDIHGCTRALRYALKHPLVKPDHQTHLHPTTIPTQQTKRKVKMPGPTETVSLAGSSKMAHLKKVLDDIRTQRHDIEANLAQVLTPRTSHEKKTAIQLQKESKRLLIEMQNHYDRVRATSLDSVSPQQTINSGSPSSISKRLKSVRFS